MTLDALIQQLEAPHPTDRSRAALQLGEMRETRAVDALVQLLRTDADLSVQEDTTWALVRLGEAAIAPLLDALAHPEAQVRHSVVHTLGKIAHVRAVDALIAATNDTAQVVRYKAVYALGQIGDARAVPALVARLDDPGQDVQWMARETLEGFGLAALDALIAALQFTSVEARELAASLLGDLLDERAVEPLIAALDTDAWPVRFAVVQALGQIGDARARPALEHLTHDPDARVSAIARRMLKMLS